MLINGTAIDVLWVSKRDGVAGIRAAASADGGKTFTPARSITPAGLTGPRGWESASLGPDGVVHAVWLDGRNTPPPAPAAADGAVHHHGAMQQDIYHAMWTGAGAPVEVRVASDVCFCCKTAVVSRGRDVFVAWRHLFPGGVRDIAVARSADEGRTFTAPVRVSEDNWKIDACPDDGPAMTIGGDGAIRVSWPTLITESGTPRLAIFEATSHDRGATFSARARVDAASAGASHPKMAAGAAGRTAVVWDELAGGARRIMLRVSGSADPLQLSTGRAASYPAIVAADGGFVVGWTDQVGQASTIFVTAVR